ncbi:MAG: GNAT family N-acetyltransferase [Pseudohongiella sp.]|nr:GNAT family N-acetyltransferase [Pseudohongiella sp.]MDO9521260.1 GNAT family N-acetyltransferase [Pseudohongiella sp.]MDP2127283.1 GNAT family N-acetyltransferase [Pseudohongiella sp.]
MTISHTSAVEEQPTLATERLRLRPYRLDDAPRIKKLAGERDVAEMTRTIPHPYPEGEAERWIQQQPMAWQNGSSVTFAVTLRNKDETIGTVGLFNRQDREAEIGYWIGVPFQGEGYCTEAVEALIGFGIAELGVTRFYASHLKRNPASGAVLRNAGLRKIGKDSIVWRDGVSQEQVELYELLIEDEPPADD